MDEDDVKALTNYLSQGIYPEGLSQDDRRTFRQKSTSFACEKDDTGILRLYHCGKNGKRRQLVVYDVNQKQEIMRAAHHDLSTMQPARFTFATIANGNAPHNGINTTLRKINKLYWWRRLVEDVRTFCKNCESCVHRMTSLSAGVTSQLMVSYDRSSDIVVDNFHDNANDTQSETALPLAPREPANIECTVRNCPTYPIELLSILDELHEKQVFCDVVLASDDGTFQTRVHKLILVAASAYLRSLLLDPALPFSDFITLPDVSGECLKVIVGFLYSGTLRLTPDTALLLLAAATRLEIPSVIELCRAYIDSPQQQVEDGKRDKEWKDSGADLEDVVQTNGWKDEMPMEIEGVCEAVNADEKLQSNREAPSSSTVSLVPCIRSARIASRLQAKALETCKQLSNAASASLAKKIVITTSKRNKCANRPSRAAAGHPSQSNSGVLALHSQKSDPDWQPEMASSVSNCSQRRSSRRKNDTTKPLPGSKESVSNAAKICRKTTSRTPATRISFKRHKSDVCLVRRTKTASCLLSHRLLRSSMSYLARSMACDGFSRPFTCRLCVSLPKFRLRSELCAHFALRHKPRFPISVRRGSLTSDPQVTANIGKRSSAVKRSPVSRLKTSAVSSVPLRNKCGWCGMKFDQRSDLLAHRETMHRRLKAGEADDAGGGAASPSARRTSRVVMRDWRCLERGCNLSFKKKDLLQDHMAKTHPSVIYTCPCCRFQTRVEPILKRHLLRRHRECHSCQECGKAYHKPFLLRVHLFNSHRIKHPLLRIHRCEYEGCGYECPTKHALAQHLLRHAQPDAFSCHLCGRTFKRAGGLDKHVNKLHLGIRPYICDKCGVSYPDELELRSHMSRHAEIKPFCCQFCNFSTFQKGSLKSHLFCRHQVMIDNRTRVLRCDACNFVTDKRCRFEDHVKMHLNIRDIACSYCAKLFVTKKTLRQHINKVHRRSGIAGAAAGAIFTPSPIAVISMSPDVIATDSVVPSAGIPMVYATSDTNTFHPGTQSSFQAPTTTFHPQSATNAPFPIVSSPVATGSNQQQLEYSTLPVVLQHTPAIGDASNAAGTIQYHMLMPLNAAGFSSATSTPSTTTVHQMAATAVAARGQIVVEIPLSLDNLANFQPFQQFDLQVNRVGL